MKRGFICIIALIAMVFFVSGCETVPKKFKEEVSGIKSRVENLESKVEGVEAKQQQAERITSEQAQALEEMKTAKPEKEEKTNISVKSRSSMKGKSRVRDIQTCLKNAGFYTGKIDGKMGAQTREAIKAFQKANNLHADGKVGGQTWAALKDYLYKKTK